MSARSLPALAACTLLALAGSTLEAQNPVATALQAFAGRAARNLIAAAEEIPADKYGYKPTPAQMSVGQVVIHLANGNDKMCGWVAGSEAPAAPQLTPADSKEKLVARLKQSFDFCTTALVRTNDANLADSVPFFGGRKLT